MMVSGMIGCQATPQRTETRLQRQLERLAREFEAVTKASGLSPVEQDQRRRQLEAELKRTLAALSRHLESLAEDASEAPLRTQEDP